MTVVNEVVTKTYQGNGLVSEWPIPFQLPADGAQYVQVYVAEPNKEPVLVTSNYRADLSAGIIQYPVSGSPLTSGYKITLRRHLPYTQGTDLNSQGPFDPETIEDAHDLSTMQIQQIAEEVGRAVKVSIGSEKTVDDYTEELFAAASEASGARDEAVAAKESAEAARVASAQSAVEAGDILQDIQTEGASAVSDINTAATSGVSQIQNEAGGLLQDIQTKGASAVSNINTAAVSGISQVQNEASSLLLSIQTEGASAVSNINTAAATGVTAIQNTLNAEIDNMDTLADRAEIAADRSEAAAAVSAESSRGLEFDWQGTELGVRREGDSSYIYVNLSSSGDYLDLVTLLGLKADQTAVDTALALKSDKTTVNTALALKADTSTVNTALALKADKTTLDALATTVGTNTNAITAKADTTTVNTALALKADKTALDALAAEVASGEVVDLTPLWDAINSIDSIPVGIVAQFVMDTPPDDTWVIGDGSLKAKADYPDLALLCGNIYTPTGQTAPTGYFYLPDYRDYFLRGHNPSGTRELGSSQSDAMRNITGTFRIPAHSNVNHAVDGIFYKTGATGYGFYGSSSHSDSPVIGLDASLVVPTAAENRPVNKTVLICIKAKSGGSGGSGGSSSGSSTRQSLPITNATDYGSWYYKIDNKTVLVNLDIKPTVSTTGAIVATLPEGFYPTDRPYQITLGALNETATANGVSTMYQAIVTTDGSITMLRNTTSYRFQGQVTLYLN